MSDSKNNSTPDEILQAEILAEIQQEKAQEKNFDIDGFVVSQRSLLDTYIMKDPLMCWLWHYMLYRANYAPGQFTTRDDVIVNLERGQLLMSVRDVNKQCSLNPPSRGAIRRRLTWLRDKSFIKIEAARVGSKITILNYGETGIQQKSKSPKPDRSLIEARSKPDRSLACISINKEELIKNEIRINKPSVSNHSSIEQNSREQKPYSPNGHSKTVPYSESQHPALVAQRERDKLKLKH